MDKLEDVKWRMIGWFSQLWTQLWTQLRKKPEKKKKRKEKIQYLNGIWTRDLAIPVRCSNQWGHPADLFHIHLSQTWRRLKRIAIALFENLLN